MAAIKVHFQEDICRRQRDESRTLEQQVLEMFPSLVGKPFQVRQVRATEKVVVYEVVQSAVPLPHDSKEVAVASKALQVEPEEEVFVEEKNVAEADQSESEAGPSNANVSSESVLPGALSILSDNDLRAVILAALNNERVKDVLADLLVTAVKDKAAYLERVVAGEQEAARRRAELEAQAMAEEERRLQAANEAQAHARALAEAASKPPPSELDERSVAIQTLGEMGFADAEQCGRMFDRFGPSLDDVVARLIEEAQNDF